MAAVAVLAVAIVDGVVGPTTAPLSFVRLSIPAPNRFELQTLSLRVQLTQLRTVEIVGTVHLASESYFASMLADAADADLCLCELVVPERCLARDERGMLRLREPIAPAPEQRRLAAQLGLQHQLDGLPYGADRRFSYVADVPAEQLVSAPARGSGSTFAEVARTFWRGSMRGAALGAGRARRGPPAWQQLLRAMAWVVPCPEVSLLILDWAWSRTRPQLSSLLRPLGLAILTLDLRSARQLAFAQVLLSSSAEGGGGSGVVFSGGGLGARVEGRMQQRNAAAIDALALALHTRDDDARAQTEEHLALFYGPLHLEGPSGIVADLLSRWPGARIVETRWRTAFAAQLGAGSPPVRGAAAPERLLLPLFLAIDALDWWLTCADVAASLGAAGELSGEALACALYVGRHALLYWSLSRFALDWSGRFED
ncbi:hypothetical protein KFE25_000588 [Diacronema lutheri]|uniref:Uncharacterized protein n=1 Tax=Diacronema lutheri TaxID=2081491 RepID=A0A8J6CA65_DIALT|nr:hypothetical protein KFE25_000588 [Diacronema lutheri]